jgi:pimeloyl-ACP methyl ester carboxylesterase
MMGGTAHYDGIVAFSQTDFTEDLKKFSVPTLLMHSEDDQIVPYADSGPLSAKLVKGAVLKPTRVSRTACQLRKPTPSTPICSPSSKAPAQHQLSRLNRCPTLVSE